LVGAQSIDMASTGSASGGLSSRQDHQRGPGVDCGHLEKVTLATFVRSICAFISNYVQQSCLIPEKILY
jgi:hypothetical protein